MLLHNFMYPMSILVFSVYISSCSRVCFSITLCMPKFANKNSFCFWNVKSKILKIETLPHLKMQSWSSTPPGTSYSSTTAATPSSGHQTPPAPAYGQLPWRNPATSSSIPLTTNLCGRAPLNPLTLFFQTNPYLSPPN